MGSGQWAVALAVAVAVAVDAGSPVLGLVVTFVTDFLSEDRACLSDEQARYFLSGSIISGSHRLAEGD